MFDIHARVEAAQALQVERTGDTTILKRMCQVLKNVVMNFETLSEGVADIFLELAGGEYQALRVKFACFLVVNRIYFTLDSKGEFCFFQRFLGEIARTFFHHQVLDRKFQYQAYFWAREFFRTQQAVLFQGDSEAVCGLCSDESTWLGSSEQLDATPLLEQIEQHHFGVTLKEERLLEHFFAHVEETNKLII